MRLSDTMLGILLVLFGLVVGLYAQSFPDIPGQKYGAAVFPVSIAFGFVICGLMMLVHGLRSAPAPLITRSEWTRKPGALLAVAITIVCVMAYVLFARQVGFIPMAVAILLVLFRMLGVPWGKAIAYAIGSALVCDFVFRTLLLVPLPFGFMPRPPW